MDEPQLLVSENDGVARVVLNRPHKRNALTRELLQEMRSSLIALSAQTDLRLVVLCGNGPVFCAGMDLAQMHETARHPDASAIWRSDTALYRDVVAALFELSTPTLAVVGGPVLAGGLGLVLACDLVLAAETATFALPEPKRGITAAVVTPLLTYRVGVSAASYLLLAGQSISARRAREVGLCHELCATAQIEAQAARLIHNILTGAPGALSTSKRQLRAGTAALVLSQLDAAMAVSAQARETAEAREGLQAFLDKRPPAWEKGS